MIGVRGWRDAVVFGETGARRIESNEDQRKKRIARQTCRHRHRHRILRLGTVEIKWGPRRILTGMIARGRAVIERWAIEQIEWARWSGWKQSDLALCLELSHKPFWSPQFLLLRWVSDVVDRVRITIHRHLDHCLMLTDECPWKEIINQFSLRFNVCVL